MSLDAAGENKGVLLRKQSVPHWKKRNQICDNQTGDEFGADREHSPMSLWRWAGVPVLAVPVLWGCGDPQSCTDASHRGGAHRAADVQSMLMMLLWQITRCFEMMVMFSLPVSVFFLRLSWPADVGKGPKVPCVLGGRLQRLN